MSSNTNTNHDTKSGRKSSEASRDGGNKKRYCPCGEELTLEPIDDCLLWAFVRSKAAIIQNVKIKKESSEKTNTDANTEEGCRIYIPINPLQDIYEEEVTNIFERSVKFWDAVDIKVHPKYNKVMIIFVKGLKAEDGPDPDKKFGFEGEPGAHVLELVPRHAWDCLKVSFEQYEQSCLRKGRLGQHVMVF